MRILRKESALPKLDFARHAPKIEKYKEFSDHWRGFNNPADKEFMARPSQVLGVDFEDIESEELKMEFEAIKTALERRSNMPKEIEMELKKRKNAFERSRANFKAKEEAFMGFVLDHVKDNPAVRKFVVQSEAQIKPEIIEILRRSLTESASSIRWLEILQSGDLDLEVIEKLQEIFRSDKSEITNLHLRTRISDEGFEMLCQSWKGSSLRKLSLEYGKFSENKIENLASVLRRQDCEITSLEFFNSNFEDCDFSEISGIIAGTKIEELVIVGCKFNPHLVDRRGVKLFVREIAEAVQNSPNIKKLRLSYCEMTELDLKHLVKALKENESLEILDLTGISKTGRTAEKRLQLFSELGELVAVHKSLKELIAKNTSDNPTVLRGVMRRYQNNLDPISIPSIEQRGEQNEEYDNLVAEYFDRIGENLENCDIDLLVKSLGEYIYTEAMKPEVCEVKINLVVNTAENPSPRPTTENSQVAVQLNNIHGRKR